MLLTPRHLKGGTGRPQQRFALLLLGGGAYGVYKTEKCKKQKKREKEMGRGPWSVVEAGILGTGVALDECIASK